MAARIMIAFVLLGLAGQPDRPAGAAPAGRETPAFGYRLPAGPLGPLWWAEGAYKVMRDDPLPARPGPAVALAAARNEFEPFLLVLRPAARLDDVRVAASDLAGPGGERIPAAAISIKRVEYVRVAVPTDAAGKAGWWPDPLPPVDGPFTAAGGENTPLWITVRVPAGTEPGLYEGTIRIAAGRLAQSVPLKLTVRAFTLPKRPSLRSSFGLPSGHIRQYHNLETRQELETVMDLYFQDLRDHRIAPSSPFELYPIEVRFSGLPWDGGEFCAAPVHGGRRALKIVDDDPESNVEARSADPIPVEAGVSYTLSFWARAESPGSDGTVLLEALDAAGRPLPPRATLKTFKTGPDWTSGILETGALLADVAALRVRLFPAFRDEAGTTRGTVWFDDLALSKAGASTNLLPGGDFEFPADEIGLTLDFEAFDRAARRYLDDFGFNAFNLAPQGLGTGSFFSRQAGRFGGFPQGSPEYDRLISRYLALLESHLDENGWLGREYIYWFDEPDPKDYPFVREGMLNIRRNAPRLTRFITEHRPGPEIMDVSEIGCTIFDRIDPLAVSELAPRGREFWSYLCTGPKSPWVTLFIDHPAVNLRIWPWMSFAWGLKGILVWRADYWNSPSLYPAGALQNPWADPMSYTVGYGIPFGQPNLWGNGDGRFLYPPNRDPDRDKTKRLEGPVDSLRWEILREGIEDYEYFVLLEKAVAAAGPDRKAAAEAARALLKIPGRIFTSGRDYTKDPRLLLEHRDKIAAAIESLTK